jgi:uncharacterized protein YecE (DUF72 family)
MTKLKHGSLMIGTSNIVVPGNKLSFPPEFQNKSRLHYYSTLFNSVELNTTFYKLPMAATFEKWSRDVPAGFRFSIKLWKGITHQKGLQFNAADIDLFLKRAASLNDKKGSLLLQFPGKITLEYFNKVEEILKAIINSDYANGWKPAVEFRNISWNTGETFELLDAYNACIVLHDHPKAKNNELNKTAGLVYIRYHGPTGDYKGSYSQKFLTQQAEKIAAWREQGKNVYVYFNNTAGDAFENARTLKALIEK